MSNRWLLCAVTFVLFSGCIRPTDGGVASEANPLTISIPDLDVPGIHKVVRLEYDFGPTPLVLRDPRGVPYPSRVVGSIHIPDGPGPFPFIVFMHGRHGTCAVVGSEMLGPVVCPDTPVTKNVRSYTGYDYLAQPLASHGYVVVSIDANNLNDLDNTMSDAGAVGRAQLISKTLDEFARLNRTAAAPLGDRLVGKLDYSRIGLMGHSRGGEGVTRFISYNRERTDGPQYPLKAVFALAPTDFARWKVTDVVHASLLPYCDGDVFNLQGAWMYDDARYLPETSPSPKIQILAMGSNHNNYNTVWTGDDGGRYNQDPHCGPTNPQKTEPGRRLSPDDQRRHGRVYMEAFFRHYVGGEAGFAPLFTAAAPVPSSACPKDWTTCEDYIHVSYQPPATHRLVVEDTMDATTLSTNDLGGESSFGAFINKTVCTAPQCQPFTRNHGRANLLQLGWASSSYWSTTIPDDVRDVSRFEALTFRAVVDYSDPKNAGQTTQDLRLVLVDESGAQASVTVSEHDNALFVPPGNPAARRAVPNEVRIPLDAFDGIDPSRLERLEFRFDVSGQGGLLFTDVMFQDDPVS